MSKPRNKSMPHPRPFIKNEKLEIYTTHSEGKITSFKAKKAGQEKEFKVVKHNIQGAWEDLEKWLGTL